MTERQQLPPVIVSLDVERIRDANQRVRPLLEFDPADVGFKIPRWLDQDCRAHLLPRLRKEGFYTIVDIREDDSVDKMYMAIRSHLVNQKTLPNALTLNPVRGLVLRDRAILETQLVPLARDYDVHLIGFAEQKTVPTHDEFMIMHELQRSESADALDFYGFEFHASTVMSSGFGARRPRAAGALKIIASKFDVADDSIKTPAEVAAECLRLHTDAVYLGKTVMNSPNPIATIEQVLELSRPA